MPTKIEIGKRYGMLTVDAATTQKDYRGRTLYHCTCECTGTRLVAADRLLAGGVISCGCMQKKAQEQIGEFKKIEELSREAIDKMLGLKVRLSDLSDYQKDGSLTVYTANKKRADYYLGKEGINLEHINIVEE